MEIYPGFAASEVLYARRGGAAGTVVGIATGDMGIGAHACICCDCPQAACMLHGQPGSQCMCMFPWSKGIVPGWAVSFPRVVMEEPDVAAIMVRAGKDGGRKETYARGMELRARATLLAEGCRGSLSEVGLVAALAALRTEMPMPRCMMHLKGLAAVHSNALETRCMMDLQGARMMRGSEGFS